MNHYKEDYLKTIFKLQSFEKKVTNQLISKELGISAASVSEMLKKLQKENYVIVDKSGVSLTTETLYLTKILLSKHRLWETFLKDMMAYSWEDVHEQADKLEHVTDDRLMQALNKLLNCPKYCPHGSPIFINLTEDDESGIALENLRVGDCAKIIRVHSDQRVLVYLDRLHLKIGTVFKIKSKDPFDNSITVQVENKEIAISYKALSYIYCEKIIKFT